MSSSLRSLDFFQDSYELRIAQLKEEREKGIKVVGTFCLYVPDEIILAAGADRIVLCGGRADTIPVAEQSLPRNICPLIRSSFGAVVDACCGGNLACPHVPMVDVVVAEATCDGKKKMYEILPEYLPTHVLDLPQKPGSPEALEYFLSELRKFGKFMEGLTGNVVSNDAIRHEIRSANETRRLLHRLFELRRRDPPPIRGSEVLRVMQKQFFLSPDQFRQGVSRLCDEMEHVTPDARAGPRIMISGCPMAAGNTKVADIIEHKGGVIVVEESCTGTRSFWDLVDEDADPWKALAERYLEIPCACMTPNDQRVARIVDLAKKYDVQGVVYYTLQFCHAYNIERLRVQRALKKEKIPLLAMESDYGDSDKEQIGIRIDAFLEMIA
ncbi:MAG TPA: double-cubane-cluster-containing anaerobic reductase [Methanomicrobiales archaeon]|jgi:benzoyl-CoA reductase/2-hydroxyglutaryl-CoA dehydratase subunit BcrC/BadD/HgdB|nr:double-cubane-cluster-containing anaerobic reductase [Methanomicrobiales archaeon]